VPNAGPNVPPESPPAVTSGNNAANPASHQSTAASAYSQYQLSLTTTRAIHQSKFSAADAALSQAMLSALTTADGSYESILDAANTSVESVMTTATTAYDAAYDTFSTAWDAAAGNPPLRQAAMDVYNATAATVDGILEASLAPLRRTIAKSMTRSWTFLKISSLSLILRIEIEVVPVKFKPSWLPGVTIWPNLGADVNPSFKPGKPSILPNIGFGVSWEY